MMFVKQLLARLITGSKLPQEAQDNARLVQQVRQTPGLIHDQFVESEGEDGTHKLHFVTSDQTQTMRPTVLFIHGSPGSWESFAPYFLQGDLLEKCRLVSLDRPGWGASSFAGTSFPSSLSVQAQLIGPALDAIYKQNQQQKILLVGHSLGGSLVPILAARYAEYINGVIILAGDIQPELAKHRWYNTLLSYVPQRLVAKHWYHSNLEILSLSQGLTLEQAAMAGVQQPITILQGTHDRLTDPKNMCFADVLFKHSALTLESIPETGHMLNLLCVDLVQRAILRSHEDVIPFFRPQP